MLITPKILPELIQAIITDIEANAEVVTELDRILGDGDHVINLQRGLNAVAAKVADLSELEWSTAWQQIGMLLMSTMGGASGSLFGTFFLALSKVNNNNTVTQAAFAQAFMQAVTKVKQRGKAEAGEKTMLDVLIPVAEHLQHNSQANISLTNTLIQVITVAETGVESTREMLATKGRASYLGERSLGRLDAGAKTSQLIINTIATTLQAHIT